VLHLVKGDVSPDPQNITLLGSKAVLLISHRLSKPVQYVHATRFHGNKSAAAVMAAIPTRIEMNMNQHDFGHTPV
jgi:hypothetical protein